jgi:L-aspartate oxidase
VKTKDVLIVGAGIAGCAVALALAKRGISVTIVTSSHDQRIYHASFIQHDQLERKIQELQENVEEQLSCSRANEQLIQLARSSVDELLGAHYLVDRNGNVDIYRCLQEQLNQFEHVEWISPYTFIDLITLDRYSLKQADRYKRPTCLGIVAYNHDTQELDHIFAKETILATGGATSLFPHSTHSSMARGEGLAIAHRAGVRLLNMEQIQFHPLGLFERDKPCFPLPLEILQGECRLHAEKTTAMNLTKSSEELLDQLYDQLLDTQTEHLWLDLTLLDPVELKDKFPTVDSYCLNHGWNIAKDALPVVPVVRYTYGGIAVDRVGQTNMHRLRAIGEVACTGLFGDFQEEALNVLESLTWAIACAEDLVKQINKLIYYFPEIKEKKCLEIHSIVPEDWQVLRHIMWAYVGIKRDRAHLKRGLVLLEQLKQAQIVEGRVPQSLACIQLDHAIQTAQLIAQAADERLALTPLAYSSSFQLSSMI